MIKLYILQFSVYYLYGSILSYGAVVVTRLVGLTKPEDQFYVSFLSAFIPFLIAFSVFPRFRTTVAYLLVPIAPLLVTIYMNDLMLVCGLKENKIPNLIDVLLCPGFGSIYGSSCAISCFVFRRAPS